jgi:glycosyltransferase involved in cell wall biosynthesis
MTKKIIFSVSNYWNSPYRVGSHHYAKMFARNGWEVLFISDPISPFHFLKKNKTQLMERFKIYKGKLQSGFENIKIYVPMSLFTPNEKPIFNSAFVTKNWHKTTIPNVTKYIKKTGFGEVDILWFDSIVQSFLVDEIKHKKSILRIADKIESFKKINPNLKNQGEILKEKADIIIYSAKTLEEYVIKYKNKAHYVPNGVDINHFLNSNREMPEDLKDIPKPVAIYIGAIDDWFGLEFLYDVAMACRDISFVLIGEPLIDISKLYKLPNFYALGSKNYNTIPNYLNNSQVGIITFNTKHPVVDTVNPIKLYEYMACELPVVSTLWKEIELINSPALLSKNPIEFSKNLYKALETGKQKKYQDFAIENSWNKRFEEIMRIYNN